MLSVHRSPLTKSTDWQCCRCIGAPLTKSTDGPSCRCIRAPLRKSTDGPCGQCRSGQPSLIHRQHGPSVLFVSGALMHRQHGPSVLFIRRALMHREHGPSVLFVSGALTMVYVYGLCCWSQSLFLRWSLLSVVGLRCRSLSLVSASVSVLSLCRRSLPLVCVVGH